MPSTSQGVKIHADRKCMFYVCLVFVWLCIARSLQITRMTTMDAPRTSASIVGACWGMWIRFGTTLNQTSQISNAHTRCCIIQISTRSLQHKPNSFQNRCSGPSCWFVWIWDECRAPGLSPFGVHFQSSGEPWASPFGPPKNTKKNIWGHPSARSQLHTKNNKKITPFLPFLGFAFACFSDVADDVQMFQKRLEKGCRKFRLRGRARLEGQPL